MKILKIFLSFIIVSTLILNLNLFTGNKEILSIKNKTGSAVDMELLNVIKPNSPAMRAFHETYVETVEPGELNEIKIKSKEIVQPAKEIGANAGFTGYIQTINVWKATPNKQKPQRDNPNNFLGVLLFDHNKQDPNRILTCTLENKPKEVIEKYRNDQDKLELGLYDLKCDSPQATWLSGTSAGWTQRAL